MISAFSRHSSQLRERENNTANVRDHYQAKYSSLDSNFQQRTIQILAMRSPLYLVMLISLLSIQLVRSSIGEPEQRPVDTTNPERAEPVPSVDQTSSPSLTTDNRYSESSTTTTAARPTEQTTPKSNSAMKQTTMSMFIVLTISLFVR